MAKRLRLWKRFTRWLRLIFGSTRLRVAIPILFILLPLAFGAGVSVIIDEQKQKAKTQEVRELLEDLRYQLISLVITNSVMGLVLGFGLVSVMVRPIERIQQTADNLARGRFDAKLDFDRTSNEIGMMGRSFNTMIDSLHRMFSERNSYMMEHMSGAIMAISPGGTVQSVNNLACDFLHLTEEQLVGQNLLELLGAYPENVPLIDALEECLDGSRSLFSHRAILAVRPGEVTPVSVSTSPLHTSEGRTYSTVVNLQNIEKLREFYRNVNRTDRLAAIGTLAMGMAHEIRNPLGSIKGLTQLMVQDAAQDTDTRRFGEVILGEVDRLDKLLGELLNFSQPAGTTVEPVDLATMAGHVVDMATIRITERAEESGKPLPPCTLELPVTGVVIASRDKLFQALFNIVINAFEAALGVGEVVVSTHRVGEGKVRLRITNTGSTIPEEFREKIFEPFFTTKERGTGLGLALAYQILTYAGANIQLRAESDQVTFDVDFPAGLGNGKPTLVSAGSSSGEYRRPDTPV